MIADFEMGRDVSACILAVIGLVIFVAWIGTIILPPNGKGRNDE